MVALTLLHTNDLHGHLTEWVGWGGEMQGRRVGGYGRLAAAVASARQEAGADVLLLDAGDLIGDTMVAERTRGAVMIDALNQLACDAMTVGNHEVDFGIDMLRERAKQANFPVLAANLIDAQGDVLFKSHIVRQVGGVRVGLLGLAYPKTSRTTAPKNIEGVTFRDPIDTARDYVPRLRKDGAEILVALTHLGLSADLRLAEAVPGIDVIVGGHSHNRMTKAAAVGRTLIVQAGAHGSDLGRLDLEIRNGAIVSHRRTLIALNDDLPSDATADRALGDWLAPHREAMDEIVGEVSDWLIRPQTIAGQEPERRAAESPADSLFADAIREQTHADVALLPGVGYGVPIPPGKFTAAQLRQLIPHDGKTVTMKLTGAEIREILEQSVENVLSDDPETKVGGMIQVAGLAFSYDPAMPFGHRVWRVGRGNEHWDLAAEYRVVTNGLLAAGGHNYATFRRGRGHAEGDAQYEVVRRWLTMHSPVTPPATGRIQVRTMPPGN